jgi:hypothetical protein
VLAVPWLIPALINGFWVSVIAEILIWSLLAASVATCCSVGYVGLSYPSARRSIFGFGMYWGRDRHRGARPVVLAGVRPGHRCVHGRWRW